MRYNTDMGLSNNSKSRLVLIDGNAIIHRAYHAMPPLTTPKGESIGAVQGFTNMLLKIIVDLKPKYLAVAFDRKEPTFRHKRYKEYQSHRPPGEPELISQFSKVREVVDAFGIASFDKKRYEADDIIGTLSTKANKTKKITDIIIVTGDKDQMQLVTEKVKLFMPVKGLSVAIMFGEEEVKEKLGVRPDQVVDLKAFMGDQSDNYPGIYGVGPKTAQYLLSRYETYENVFKHIDELKENMAKKLTDGKEEGDISYELAKIVTDLDVDLNLDKMSKWEIGNEKTLLLFQRFGFKNLTKRINSISARTDKEKQQKLF